MSTSPTLVGFCNAPDGHTFAFAFPTNSASDTSYAHRIEAEMAAALANYDG